ncbi:MAG: hypothetical protein D6797_01195 [Bdellovibrio sp.]|nr:MAG: hypothetical protein D6797_01195 [Bdellovibrio sp.]
MGDPVKFEEIECFKENLKKSLMIWEGSLKTADSQLWKHVKQLPQLVQSLWELYQTLELCQSSEKVIVGRVLKYLISPLDLKPEFIYGPQGFREDIYLIAMASKRWKEVLDQEIYERAGFYFNEEDWEEIENFDIDQETRSSLQDLLGVDALPGDELFLGHFSEEQPILQKGEKKIIIAGPGTGKTYRIEEELLDLLIHQKVCPESVVVTTFTNKAADELVVRVQERLTAHHKGAQEAHVILRKLTISTIHKFFYSIISNFHHHIFFLNGAFSVLDETQRLLFLFRKGFYELRLKDIYREWIAYVREKGRSYEFDLFHFYRYVGQVYDFLSEDVIGNEESPVHLKYLELLHSPSEKLSVDEKIIQTYPRYWKALQKEGYLDNSIVMSYVNALLDDVHVLRQVRQRYRYILVDEYQDTNPIQDKIFRKIVGESGNLIAVGDDDQSIYAFRGADVRNATAFERRYQGARVERLEQNRRSTPEIVRASQDLIKNNKIRYDKKIFTQNPPGEKPWVLVASKEELPDQTAQLLWNLKNQGLLKQWNDVALLFRCFNKRYEQYKGALEQHNVPFVTKGNRKFLCKPFNNGFIKILEMISIPTSISNRKRAHKKFFEDLGINDSQQMLDLIQKWANDFEQEKFDSLLDLFYEILCDVGDVLPDTCLADLGRLSSVIAEAESEIKSRDLKKRLSHFLSYVKAAKGAIEGPKEGQEEQGVQILTLHASKGLEFPVVIIADVIEGEIPADFGADVRSRLRRNLGGEEGLDKIEEERRVFYVGMTRAEELLVLTTSEDQPSRFLKEFKYKEVKTSLEELSSGKVKKFGRKPKKKPPFHASNSQLFDYEFCPQRYKLEHKYGFAGRPISALRAGRSLHESIEILHRLLREGERVTEDRLKRIFKRCWIQPVNTKKAQKEYEDLSKIFMRYAHSTIGKKNLKIIDMEQPFHVIEGHGVLTGKIDLVREVDSELQIVEFKYHQNKHPNMISYPERQLNYYRLAFPHLEPVLKVHYLKEAREESVKIYPMDETRRLIVNHFDNIVQGRFHARPSKSKCGICPVKVACKKRLSVDEPLVKGVA